MTRSRVKIVLAASKRQFEVTYGRLEGFAYVDSTEKLLGWRIDSDDVVYMPGWRDNPRYDSAFMEALNERVNSGV